MKIRVLIIEPAEIIAEGLTAILREQTRFKVLDPIPSLDALEERTVTGRPDILIVNPTLTDSPAQFVNEQQIPVIALVYQYVEQTTLKRFDAIIDIRDDRATLADTIVRIFRQHNDDDKADKDKPSYELSRRETDVLVLVAKGKTNKEIADALNVSIHTVISHRKNIIHKTGIKSVAGLTVYAILNGLINESTAI